MKHNNCLVYVLYLLVSFSFAQELTSKQQEILDKLHDDAYENYEKHNYAESIKNGSKLVRKGIEYNAPYYKFYGYDLIGSTYDLLDDTINSRIYAEKALELALEINSDSLKVWSYNNLGSLYSNNKNTIYKGIRYLEKGLEINNKNNTLEESYLIYLNLASTYLELNKFDKVFINLSKAKSIAESHSVLAIDVQYYKVLLSEYYIKKGLYKRAIKDLELLSKEVDRDSVLDNGLHLYENLSIAYNKVRDFEKAYNTLIKYNHYNDRIYEKEKLQAIGNANASFGISEYEKNLELIKKEKVLSDEVLEKRKYLNYVLIALVSVMFLALLGFFFLFKDRKKYVTTLKVKNVELTTAKNKAEKLSKIKSNFFSTVSHELRTPLYGVIGISSMLQEDNTLAHHKEDLESLKFSADYLLALINDVLLLNKMEVKGINKEENPFQLNVLINSIVKSFEFNLKQNKNRLHLNIDNKIPNFLIGDSVRFSQILMNLVGNATKFNENGNIWLDLKLLNALEHDVYEVEFSIKDDGIGIAPSKQESVFEEFSQVENNNFSLKGTGLGLPIVKKLLDLHDSEIVLNSELGKGSEFTFVLKLKRDTKKTENNQTKNISVNDLDKLVLNEYLDKQILVVDDNKINQKITQRILKKHHFNSSLASDGQEAIDMVSKYNYDLILMDINMPNVNGVEATLAIRKFNTTVPIIALTAVEIDEVREKIISSGMNDIILKPYDVSLFLSTILRNLKSK